jgi:hypothetical protein
MAYAKADCRSCVRRRARSIDHLPRKGRELSPNPIFCLYRLRQCLGKLHTQSAGGDDTSIDPSRGYEMDPNIRVRLTQWYPATTFSAHINKLAGKLLPSACIQPFRTTIIFIDIVTRHPAIQHRLNAH